MREGKEPIVPQICDPTIGLVTVMIVLAQLSAHGAMPQNADAPVIRTADIGHGIALHYVEEGKGTPVIFVHGSLSDGGDRAAPIRPLSQTLSPDSTTAGNQLPASKPPPLD